MGFTTNSLDLIRRVFRRDQMIVGAAPDVVDTMDFASRGQAAMSQAYGPMAGGVESYMHDSVSLNHDLHARYEDYEGMDEFPEISVAFDLFADDATVQDVLDGKSIWYEAPDEVVQGILNDMLEKQIRAEDSLWEQTREACKYGNHFAEIIALDQQGVVDLKSMYVPSMRRIQDQDGILYGFVHDPALSFSITTSEFFDRIKNRDLEDPMKVPQPQSQIEMVKVFEPWEVVHFRNQGNNSADIYGISIANAARYAWKRLMMMEDSMVVYKLTRAAQRYAFYIDVGDVPPAQAKRLLQQVKNEFKKEKVLDSTGKVSYKYSPMCLSLSTRIPLLSGETKTLQELIKDHDAGVKNYTYSLDRETGLVAPGEISWAGVTRRDAKLVRVTLDNCQQEVVTPDHKFLLRSGEYREAKDLKAGDSLMPFNRGIRHSGYEYVVHPSNLGWDNIEATHRLVARHYQSIEDLDVHHKDEKKRNNAPENLQVLTREEHQRLHNHFVKWNQTREHSEGVSACNRKYGKGQNIVNYNNSPKHAEDNVIRAAAVSKYRAEVGEEHNRKLRIKFPASLKVWLFETIRCNPEVSLESLTEMLRLDETASGDFRSANTRPLRHIHRGIVASALREFGFDDYRSFKKAALYNHKVVEVEFLDHTEDTGCITVDRWHNFALESGIFVKNSADEDLFLAVRKDKRTTEVEVLSAPEGQLIEDVNYFKEKLIAALKVPKSYLAGDDTVGRANLAQLDVRMARSVMRIQRVMKNGYHQVGRVDLAAKNIDPDMVEFRCMMNIPSGVLEMAQVEVQNAKLDLAAKYRDAGFSQYYIWSRVLGLSEDEIQMIRGQAESERGATQSQAESVQRVITMDIDKGSQQAKKMDRHINQIREEIEAGRTDFGKKMRELRLLMQEVKYSMSAKRGVRWQPEGKR